MKSAAPDIRFHFQKQITLRERRRLKIAIGKIFNQYNKKLGSLNIIFCSDDYLLEVNREYLQHDYYTDIITFNLAESGQPVSGEIYISAERVKENAATVGVAFSNELHRVIFHGVLHLCGFTDETALQKKNMRAHEDKALTLLSST